MKRTRWLIPIIALVGVGVAHGASLRKGQALYEHGLMEDAKHALVDVVTGDAGNDEKAGALYLLGTIALEQQHYPIAARMWSDLIQRFPESTEAREARRRLSTIPNGFQSSRVRIDAPRGSAPDDPFEGVFVTGQSANPKYSGQMVNGVVTFLNARGVPVSHEQPAKGSAVSVLTLAMTFGYKDSLQATCYSADGNEVWSEKATGIIGLSRASVAEGLIDRIKPKIESHIGDQCLRKS